MKDDTRFTSIETLLGEIQKKKDLLASLRPLDESELKRLQEDFIIETTYDSNAIEGSTISLDETYMILKEGITIGGNGRTGRLLLNLELIKNGYLPINIKYKDVEEYYNCFNAYRENDKKDYSEMLKLVVRYELEELDRYLDIVREKESLSNSRQNIPI